MLEEHWVKLQVSWAAADPRQVGPPYLGAGFVHVLDLTLEPLPHVTLHAVHGHHSAQPPAIKKFNCSGLAQNKAYVEKARKN